MTRIARAGALLALALLTALCLAGPTAAARQPQKHGKGVHRAQTLKQWSKQHKAKGGAKADPDGDGLTNRGEFRAHTKPGRADSDRDGLGDAQEDFDRDGLDNGSEEDAGTDPAVKDSDADGVKDGAEDPDRDRLANAAEDRTGNHPRDPDSDDDGTADGDENAGVVQAFDGYTLTVALAAGGSLTGVVDEDSFVACDGEATYEDQDGTEDGDDDPELDEDLTDEELALLDEDRSVSVRAHLAEQGDEDDIEDEDWGADDCDADLVPGTAVHEAEIEDGVFTVLELLSDDR